MPPALRSDVMTRQQTAKFLQVCPLTVSHWVRDRGLPAHRLGGHAIRFLRSEVLAWTAAQTEKGTDGRRCA